VVGPNGAGKTNLLEAVHVAVQGFSPRTRSDVELIRFGEAGAKLALRGTRNTAPIEIEVVLRRHDGKRAILNGARLRAAEQLRREVATLTFTPDRLAVVKAGPAVRRAYFDRVLERLVPARARLPTEYAAAVGQRNAALRRVAAGLSSRDALGPWTARVAQLGAELVETRREAIRLLTQRFALHGDGLGLEGARLVYEAEPPTAEALEGRLETDLARGTTGAGPHLDDVRIFGGRHELRSFGSQGEQRLAVLALLLAEAELITERHKMPPLLLLDDVLSEFDAGRRRALARLLTRGGQTLITATARELLPAEPDQVLRVSPGAVEAG